MNDAPEYWNTTTEEGANLLERFRVDDKVAVITGAGRGIGRGIALGLADAGADLVLTARRSHELDEVAELVCKKGRRAVTVVADITADGTVARVIESATTELGGIDVWVSNAGGSEHPGSFAFKDFPEWHWDGQLDLNLRPHFIAARALADVMQPGSSIIGIASIAGIRPAVNFAGYGAAKAAMIHLTKTLSIELGPLGIRANVVSPGNVPTESTTTIGHQSVADIAKRARDIPLQRLGTPQDVAAAVLYLASPAGAWVTGQNLVVSGGQ